MHKQTVEVAKRICRDLRKRQTPSEGLLWQALRNRRFADRKFTRQYPIFFTDPSGNECFYIADFFCHAHRLIIELDGRSHFSRREYDESRSDILEGMGYRVLRFRNEEVEENLEKVLEKLAGVMALTL